MRNAFLCICKTLGGGSLLWLRGEEKFPEIPSSLRRQQPINYLCTPNSGRISCPRVKKDGEIPRSRNSKAETIRQHVNLFFLSSPQKRAEAEVSEAVLQFNFMPFARGPERDKMSQKIILETKSLPARRSFRGV